MILAHGPLLAFATVALGGVWLSSLGQASDGRAYVLLALVNALITILASAVILVLEVRRPAANGPAVRMALPTAALVWLVALVGALATTTVLFWDSIWRAIS